MKQQVKYRRIICALTNCNLAPIYAEIKGNTMQISVEEIINSPGDWTVEAIGSDGEIYKTDFTGPDAEKRAKEYAKLKYGFEVEGDK